MIGSAIVCDLESVICWVLAGAEASLRIRVPHTMQ